MDFPVHASTAEKNNIQDSNDDDSDDLKNLNDEILILDGKGCEKMVGGKKANEIDMVMSSIMDTNQSLSVENFDSYDQESTESAVEKLNFVADIDCDDVRGLFLDWANIANKLMAM